jgi:hypothetical protein
MPLADFLSGSKSILDYFVAMKRVETLFTILPDAALVRTPVLQSGALACM